MAKLEGLNRRGERWYLRIIIPVELRDAYGGKTQVNPGLKTADKAEALRLGHALRAQWLADFDTKRRSQQRMLRLNPQALPAALAAPSVPPELAATLAARVRHRVLAGDDLLRGDPLRRSDLAHYVKAQGRPLAAGRGLPRLDTPNAPYRCPERGHTG